MYRCAYSERQCETGVSGQKQDLAALFLAKDPCTHLILGCVSPGVYRRFRGEREKKKTLALAAFDIKVVLFVAKYLCRIRYTGSHVLF